MDTFLPFLDAYIHFWTYSLCMILIFPISDFSLFYCLFWTYPFTSTFSITSLLSDIRLSDPFLLFTHFICVRHIHSVSYVSFPSRIFTSLLRLCDIHRLFSHAYSTFLLSLFILFTHYSSITLPYMFAITHSIVPRSDHSHSF